MHDIYRHTSDENTLLCAFWKGNTKDHVTTKNITDMLHSTAVDINLTAKGFPLSRISPHSLRAGGATALALAGYDVMIIQKYGRWSSNTFMNYIHEQIAHLGKGVAKNMGKERNFHNVAGFT